MKKYILLVFLIVVGVGGYYLFNNLEIIVKKLVNKYGSEITGTEVDLKGFKINLASGEAKVTKFTVANPKGYENPYLFSADEVFVKVNLKSLTSGTIVIDEIRVEKPAMTYEMLSVTQNNIAEVLSNVKNNTSKAEEKVQEDAKNETKSGGAGTKVVINKVDIKDTTLKAAIAAQGISGVAETQAVDKTVTLPDITIRDIGKSKNGASIVAVISTVMTKILNTATQAAVEGGLGDLKGAAEKGLSKAIDSAKEKIDLKGLFGK